MTDPLAGQAHDWLAEPQGPNSPAYTWRSSPRAEDGISPRSPRPSCSPREEGGGPDPRLSIRAGSSAGLTELARQNRLSMIDTSALHAAAGSTSGMHMNAEERLRQGHVMSEGSGKGMSDIMRDLYFYLCNNHVLLSAFLAHKDHPYPPERRRLVLVNSIGFGTDARPRTLEEHAVLWPPALPSPLAHHSRFAPRRWKAFFLATISSLGICGGSVRRWPRSIPTGLGPLIGLSPGAPLCSHPEVLGSSPATAVLSPRRAPRLGPHRPHPDADCDLFARLADDDQRRSPAGVGRTRRVAGHLPLRAGKPLPCGRGVPRCCLVLRLAGLLTDRPTDRPTDWPAGALTGSLAHWLTHWLTHSLTHSLTH